MKTSRKNIVSSRVNGVKDVYMYADIMLMFLIFRTQTLERGKIETHQQMKKKIIILTE